MAWLHYNPETDAHSQCKGSKARSQNDHESRPFFKLQPLSNSASDLLRANKIICAPVTSTSQYACLKKEYPSHLFK